MDLPFLFIDLVLHIDKYLPGIIESYGFWTYLILFAIIFCETGLVITPYLPGDSLLFVAGTLAGAGYLNIEALIIILLAAAILGDTVNYWIGHTAGMKVLEKKYSCVRVEHLEKTREYFAKYGGMTVVIARFVPFIRTFAPFLAGVGKMSYRWFLTYNIVGAVLWVLAFTLVGFFFGGLPIIKENFSLIVYLIIGVSMLAVGSIIFQMLRQSSCNERVTGPEGKN
ncbi:VTT domain-containing protein [Methanoregula sp.]|uniref:VTT domain-containing protein n=1 Tax=Methanoregula sp. TaxID=2052170 RepID=UPI0026111465|nr:VTT domain-containing protein [Methanoregula sp.]MDD5142571.1 VTT domain-containing protein [Methanoregula sp.]